MLAPYRDTKRARRLPGRAVAVSWSLAAALGVLAAGCERVESIQSYTIPKQAEVEKGNPTHRKAPAPRPVAVPARMLGAIFPASPRGWFFKLLAPPEAIAPVAPTFERFVRSVKLKPGEAGISWQLPSGWREEKGAGERFATIIIPTGEETMSLTVTALAGPGRGEETPYILSNVNRWRGQLRLPPIAAGDLDKEITLIDLDGGVEAWLVDIQGEWSGGGMGGAPAAIPPTTGPGTPAVQGGDGPQGAPAGGSPGFKYKRPDGWTDGRAGGMRLAAFDINQDGRSAEVTVIAMPRSKTDLLAQVNRWRGQVGLPATTQDELAKVAQPIQAGEIKGNYVEAIGLPKEGAAADSPRRAILVAVLLDGDMEWFIKLTGDAEVAERERTEFQAFVKSFRLE